MDKNTRVLIDKSCGSGIGNFVWGDSCTVGSIESKHDDHIMVRLSNDENLVRFNLTKNKFRDTDGDECIEVEFVEESLPEDCVVGSAIYKDRDCDEGIVHSIYSDRIVIGYWSSGEVVNSNKTVQLSNIQKYHFKPAVECPTCKTKDHWDPSRVPQNGTDYCHKCAEWFGTTPPPIGTRFYDSDGSFRCKVVEHVGNKHVGISYHFDDEYSVPTKVEHAFMMGQYRNLPPKETVSDGINVGQQVGDKKNDVVLGTVKSIVFGKEMFGKFRDWVELNTGDSHSSLIYLDLDKFHDNYKVQWIVDDEFERQIHVGDIIFMKETGEKVGEVSGFDDDNCISARFNSSKVHMTTLDAYNPRVEGNEFGFHRPGECGTDIHRMQFVTALENNQESPNRGPKVCPQCNKTDKWQASVRKDNGTDFCMRCCIWYTPGNPSTTKLHARPTYSPAFSKEDELDPAVDRLRQSGMSFIEAEAYLKRMRLPEVGVGDLLTTKAGVFRFMTNGWVLSSGPLKKRSTETTLGGDIKYTNVAEPQSKDVT